MTEKQKINLTMVLSDCHFGHENCLYETYWYTIDKMISEIKMLKQRYDVKNAFLIINGDMVSGTLIYRNQFLENQLNKNEDIVIFGSYMMFKTIKKLSEALGLPVKSFIVAGNHEGSRRVLAHNFSLAISRRLNSYGAIVRYSSNYLILDIAHELSKDEYNVMAFHGWGNADYSSASPSVVRELTRVHSQLATEKNIIIQRFTVGHTHWLEPNRSVLGIRFDTTGGFQKWEQKVSWRESGMLYYVYRDDGEFDVRGVSGQKKQLEEMDDQGLHVSNIRYVSDVMEEAIEYEVDIGLLQPKDVIEK